jgi:hypothetical protein
MKWLKFNLKNFSIMYLIILFHFESVKSFYFILLNTTIQ